MYIKDGIAYAGEPEQPIRISGVRPLDTINYGYDSIQEKQKFLTLRICSIFRLFLR